MDMKVSNQRSPTRIGYACINITLAEQDVSVNRTARIATIESKGIEHIRELILKNLRDCLQIMQWNEDHGIRFYRMSSSMISHIGNDKLSLQNEHSLDFARPLLLEIGNFARKHSHRLSFHVGQYTLLSSSDPGIIARSVADLTSHSDVLDAIDRGYSDNSSHVHSTTVRLPHNHLKVADAWFKPPQGVIILHGGGMYGDKPSAIATIRKNIAALDPRVRRRIVLENDEKSYCPDDLLPICEEFSIPFCLDVFHYKCYYEKSSMSSYSERSIGSYATMLRDDAFWKRCRDTWGCGCDCNEFFEARNEHNERSNLVKPLTKLKGSIGGSCVHKVGGCGSTSCNRCAKCNLQENQSLSNDRACTCRRMKIHISSQKINTDDDVRIPLGAHADYINPDEIDLAQVWRQCNKFGADIMVEAKAKELACMRVMEFVSKVR